jgi:tRNA U34 5-methylaminomethyl-2-thiouridine-forming methyltransferase MnmC
MGKLLQLKVVFGEGSTATPPLSAGIVAAQGDSFRAVARWRSACKHNATSLISMQIAHGA